MHPVSRKLYNREVCSGMNFAENIAAAMTKTSMLIGRLKPANKAPKKMNQWA
jgi:hypothetical protein